MSRSKSIYETFNEYTIEQINEAISKLSKYEQEIFYKKNGKDLSIVIPNTLNTEEKKSYRAIFTKIKRFLENPERKTRRRVNSIYKYFDEYTSEQVDEAISKLPHEYIEILHLKFGGDFKNSVTNKNTLTNAQNTKYHNKILPKLTKLLADNLSQENNLEQKCEEEFIEELDDIAMIIDDEIDNIEIENPIIQEPITETEVIFNQTDKIIDENTQGYVNDTKNLVILDSEASKLTKEDYEIVLELIKTPLFTEMIKLLTPVEAMIVSLFLINSDNPNFSINDIAKFIGIEPQQVIEITKKALLIYKNSFNDLIDKVIELTTECPVLIKE